MKIHHTLSFGIGVASAALAMTTLPLGQDAAEQPQPAAVDMQQLMQDLKTSHDNHTMAGPFHERLGRAVGDWNVTIRVTAAPGMPAMVSTGTARIEWALGDRWLVEHLDAELNMGGVSMPLDSISITGYDSYRNVYVGAMFSSMSTEMVSMQGALDPATGGFTVYGTMHEPMLNVAGRLVRFSTEFVDDNHFATRVYDLHAGENYQVIEFTYSRADADERGR